MPAATKDATKDGQEATATPLTVPTVDIDGTLDAMREQFVSQMEALRPAHEAFVKLESMVSNFDRIATGVPARRRGTTATAGERAGRGTRPDEFLQIVRDAGDEGVTVTEAADKMGGMNANYLYRIAKDLTKKGEVRKDGKRYIAA